jgi:hypothetical protein
MSTEMRKILERLERGEIDSQDAIHMMQGENQDQYGRTSKRQSSDRVDGGMQYLRVDVHRLHDDKRQVHVRVPLRIIELGFSLGSRYAPELQDFDLKEIVDELHEMGEGTIVEVEDLDENQHVMVWIEKA